MSEMNLLIKHVDRVEVLSHAWECGSRKWKEEKLNNIYPHFYSFILSPKWGKEIRYNTIYWNFYPL